jgi:Trk K+ transport system NAD-binding subunit
MGDPDGAGAAEETTSPRRYVVSGMSRLTVRVARVLAERGAAVCVATTTSRPELESLLEASATVVSSPGDLDAALEAAALDHTSCLLALSDDDLENLHAALHAAETAPDVPVVLRAFHPELIDRLGGDLNLRRAYSVSALAAPAIVAGACSAEIEEVLRIGDEEVPLCRLEVTPGSPAAGKSPGEIKAEFGCAVIATGPSADAMEVPSAASAPPVAEGDAMLIGGPLLNVLGLALRNSGRFSKPRPGSAARRPRTPRSPKPRRLARRGRGLRVPGQTLLPIAALILALWVVMTVVVFAIALHQNPIDALYFAVSTALGNSTLDQSKAWLKVFGVGAMLAGGALIGIVFSYLASIATTQRLEQRMGRRAERLSNHAVIAGLGTIGYRVVTLFADLGVTMAVIERTSDSRFVHAASEHAPVLVGDVRLPETLAKAGMDDAACFIACTDDDLANVETCLQAKRLNPGIRTVARIFDESLAERVEGRLGIDRAVSATMVAARAFVGAAEEERAMRPFLVSGRKNLALRYDVTGPLTVDRVEEWRGRGVRFLAFRRGDGPVQAPSELTSALAPGDSVVLAGPEQAIRSVLAEDAS